MRSLVTALSFALFAISAIPAQAAINPDPSPQSMISPAHPSNKFLKITPVASALSGRAGLDHLKRRVSTDGFTTVANAELGSKTNIFAPNRSRAEFAEYQVKSVNPTAATTLLIFASGCLMWLGLYERRPY